jgi:hypothetical protein
MRATEPCMQCYQVLHEASSDGEGSGLTTSDLAARCDRRYGARHQGYWGKQLLALADMGYAEKSGRWFRCAPVWVAVAPDEQQ